MDYSLVFEPKKNSPHKKGLSPEKKAELKQLTRPDPMNPAPLLDLFKQFEVKVAQMRTEAESVAVIDDATSAQAAEMATQSRKVENQIEKKRKEAIAPYNNVVGTVNKHTKTIKSGLIDIRYLLESKNRPYLIQKEKKRQESARKAREEAARLQREAEERAYHEAARKAEEERARAKAAGASEEEAEKNAQAAAATVVVTPEIVPDLGPAETKLKTDSGSQALETEWSWELLDIRKLPDACFEARAKQLISAVAPFINASVKAGVREMSGVRIFERQTIKTRSR